MPSMVLRSALSPEAFTTLGNESLAYVRAVRSENVGFLSAEAPLLQPGTIVFVLHAADGSPLAIGESIEAVVADAASHQLDTVSVH